ncbi:MAG: YceI family protein [Bacteroidia bacterium]|nr:YceI family protein [Bacteroidia bacterium]
MYRLLLFFLFITSSTFSQVYVCKDGHTKFTSEAPLELIKAQSDKTTGVLDCSNKNVAFSIDIDSFDGFNSGLQKEHFRENYMETEKYPKATFKGKIIEDVDFTKSGSTMVRAKGIFSIHGAEKEKIVKVKITVKGKEILVESSFEVPLEDHNIKIPKVVNQKIASVIMVDVNATLKPKA